MSTYAFGDSELAARRLDMVAAAFAPPTAAFLERAARRGVELAVDLGCGTGHTTRLLHEVLAPVRTLGLERSAAFLARARERAGDGEAYAEHDVTLTPFPDWPEPDRGDAAGWGRTPGAARHQTAASRSPGRRPQIGLLFCRLLLSHLEEPAAVLARWATQLTPGGLLLLDEVDTIDAEHPALARYLEIVALLLGGRGQRLEVGPVLDALADPPGLRRVDSRAVPWAPPPPLVGEMFRANLRVWRAQPEVAELAGDAELDRLAATLGRIAAGDEPARITWYLRQMAFERV
jgi:trans-aconitate 2-methyltransferase